MLLAFARFASVPRAFDAHAVELSQVYKVLYEKLTEYHAICFIMISCAFSCTNTVMTEFQN